MILKVFWNCKWKIRSSY